jgi:hypothetical protein
MREKNKWAVVCLLACALVLVSASFLRLQADDDRDSEQSKIQRGFAIAPVHLNLAGKNPALVGLGSYIVNAQADCNGCHTAGGPPNFNYAAGHNPYLLNQGPTKTDPDVYLGGGSDFGAVGPPIGPNGYAGPDIIARNLTPDKTGRAEGGHTLAEFMQIIRMGTDFDKIHPTCTALFPTPTPANCIPPPVDGSKLQVMPWPVFNSMSDRELEAIYEYLSAIPCVEGGPGEPAERCH